MAKLITGEKLSHAVEKGTYFSGGSAAGIEGVKYDFHLSSRILKADYNRPIDMSQMTQTEQREMSINPGEIVFVLSEERLHLPNNVTVILSPKRKLSHDGILTLGGLNVDPLYEGHLLFGLHNFSSTPYPLIPGKKLIAGMFYELERSEVGDFHKPESVLEDFPADLIRLISKYQPIRLDNLSKRLDEAADEIKDLRNEIATDKQWRVTFQTGVDSLQKSVHELRDSLKDEQVNRQSGDKEILQQIKLMEDGQSKLTWAHGWIKYLIGTVVGGVLMLIITLLFQQVQKGGGVETERPVPSAPVSTGVRTDK